MLDRYKYFIHVFTFPGIILHEFAHKKMCDHFHIPVTEVVYFQFGEPSGYVKHPLPTTYTPAVLIALAPMFINTLFAISLATFASFWLFPPVTGDGSIILLDAGGVILAIWLAISFGTHAFPSGGDAKNIIEHSKRNWYNPLVLIGAPVGLVIKFISKFGGFWLEFALGVAVVAIGIWGGFNADLLYTVGQDLLTSTFTP